MMTVPAKYRLHYTDNSPSPSVGPTYEDFDSEGEALERAYELKYRLRRKTVHHIQKPDGTQITVQQIDDWCRKAHPPQT